MATLTSRAKLVATLDAHLAFFDSAFVYAYCKVRRHNDVKASHLRSGQQLKGCTRSFSQPSTWHRSGVIQHGAGMIRVPDVDSKTYDCRSRGRTAHRLDAAT